MIAVSIPTDHPGFWVGAWLIFVGMTAFGGALLAAVWTAVSRRHAWKSIVKRVLLPVVAFSLVAAILGAAIQSVWTPPGPSERLATGVSDGIRWTYYVTEVDHITCLRIEGWAWADAEVCGRPWQPRRLTSAVRLAVGGNRLHFIVGTVPPKIASVELTGRGLGVVLDDSDLIHKKRFPFRFFIVHIKPSMTSVRVRARAANGTVVETLRVSDRPHRQRDDR